MKALIMTMFICVVINCNTKPKEMAKEYSKFNGYFFFISPLKELENYNIHNSQSVWYGRLDVKTSHLELIDVVTGSVVKTLELEAYKDNIFFLKGYDNLYVNLRASSDGENGQHSLRFIKDKDDPNKLLTYGYFVFTLKSIEDCKKHLEQWKKEAEETNCTSGDCYGVP